MPLNKVANYNHTTMSLDERFTQLRQGNVRRGGGLVRFRGSQRLQAATAKNRHLAIQMARRPAVIAALNIRRGRGITRNSIGTVLRGNLQGSRFGRINSVRGNLRSLRRGQHFGRLSRSSSTTQLLHFSSPITRGFGRGRGITRTSMIRGNMGRFNGRSDVQIRRDRGNFRGRGIMRGAISRGRGTPVRRGGSLVGRGRGGRGRGRGGTDVRRQLNSNGTGAPSKEALDKELDQYMSSSRGALDKEIDTYMNHPNDTTDNWDD